MKTNLKFSWNDLELRTQQETKHRYVGQLWRYARDEIFRGLEGWATDGLQPTQLIYVTGQFADHVLRI